ncbi:uncharacterized protein [Aristolochia californica]|uniref:uncharacterized protein n=1 Tax=Aristolochia californica TaxID=171875 RepID=UPI0035D75944
MAAKASAPVEIGTRGTIGSLVLQEMEYLKTLDLNQCHPSQTPAMVASSIDSGTGFGFSTAAPKRKKKRGSGSFLPSICSIVDIIDNGMDRIPGCSYRNLRTDLKMLEG